jgi:regulator of CtrA degradation
VLKTPDKPESLWQQMAMHDSGQRLLLLNNKLVDDLYVEVMVLADEVRSYLEDGRIDHEHLDPMSRVQFSCESLKITTRLMHVIAWLLTHRAVARGEMSQAEARGEKYRLGDAAPSDNQTTRGFPDEMRILIASSQSLYNRAGRLEQQMLGRPVMAPRPVRSPARDLMRLVETSF